VDSRQSKEDPWAGVVTATFLGFTSRDGFIATYCIFTKKQIWFKKVMPGCPVMNFLKARILINLAWCT
jgi:hypothetical protein